MVGNGQHPRVETLTILLSGLSSESCADSPVKPHALFIAPQRRVNETVGFKQKSRPSLQNMLTVAIEVGC